MQINGSDGRIADVTKDHRLRVFSASENLMHAMGEEGKAWTLPFTQTGAANTTDNVVFHFKNDADDPFDIHKIVVSSAEAGLWTVEYGRTYSSAGTTITLRQLNVLSGKTQDMTTFYGTAIVLAGTATDLIYTRVMADSPVDLLSDTASLQIEPSGTFAVKFKADAGNNVMGVSIMTHGVEPWEE